MADIGLDFQLLFEESPDVLTVLLPDAPNFTIVAATKSRLVSTHLTKQQTIGKGLFELFPDNPDDAGATGMTNLLASLNRVLATQAADMMPVQKYDIRLPDGSFEVKYWSPRNSPILSPDGAVLYILHRAVEVTDLVRASEEGEELRGRTHDMEEEVLRGSRELADAIRQLRAANATLNQLDAAKTTFFSNISHEFRTPLTLMLGPVEDALADSKEPLVASQRVRLQLAHDNAVRLLKLVNALLDFSRLQAGRMSGTFAAVDLAALTFDLAMMFRGAIDGAGLRLVIQCAPLSESIWIDHDMWEKIVPNLLSNAFKFTFSGEIKVVLTESTSHAVLHVIDTGLGIPQEEQARVFERFHRVSGTQGRTHEGAGIGLSLVRELVELHGGTISLSSIVDQGSSFCIEIPKGSSHLPATSLAHGPAAPQLSANAHAHALEANRWAIAAHSVERTGTYPITELRAPRSRVLVVDDNADLRNYMAGLLAPFFEVVTANDGVAALDTIHAQAPDLVLSDVMMPLMTGIELVKALRSDPSTAALPVILISARAGAEATIEGLDAGSDDYLTKPFTAPELLARVRSHLQLALARRRWTSELERANRELDAFSYSIAHDLRAPLRSIDGFTSMVLEDHCEQLDAEGKRRLQIVRSCAHRMTQLIDDLLYLARMSRGEIRRVPIDLSSLARSVAANLQESHAERNVTLWVEEGLSVNADPYLIRIVFENLLGNAWKFTGKRAAARIEFGMLGAGSERSFYVRDNGAGFDMNNATKLFGVFQRLHSESEFQGTGIGLATVNRIIARHGGRIWATGAVDEGATFEFTLGDGAAASSTEIGIAVC